MRDSTRVTKLAAVAAAAALVGGLVVVAAPPGPIDGRNIPSNFGPGALLATQTNKTGFGNQAVTTGALTNGSELDELFIAKSGTDLKIGISGNVREPNHILIFIGGTGGAGLGQAELKAQGVDGPPFTVQNISQLVTYNTNGTADPGDDTCDITSNGTMLPCVADYAIGVDTFGSNVSVSEYTLNNSAVGSYVCGGTATSPTYATRVFVTQSTLETNPPATNDQGLGYAQIGFRNGNTAGVTSSDCSAAATATTGLEMTIPMARLSLDGTETITLFVALVSDSGFFGNQMFRSQAASCGDACTSPGFRPDDLALVTSCISVNLSTLAAFGGGDGISDGIINPADYSAPLRSTQTCATDFGDQQVDANEISLTGGSELNQLYVTNDNDFLYVGLTGNLEANGNGLLFFIHSVAGGEGGSSPLAFTGGGRVQGMTGNFLPFDQDDATVDFDYAIEINGSRPAGQPASAATYYTDFVNLLTDARPYYGSNMVNSNGSQFSPAAGNVNGYTMGYNFLNNDGVQGCGNLEPCDFASNAQVSADAATATFGLEMAIPLVDIGVTTFPTTLELWAMVTNGSGGFAANQSLPSLRDPDNMTPANPDPNNGNIVTGNSVENAGGSPTSPANLDYSNDGSVGNCAFNPPGDAHCQFAFFARTARYVAEEAGVPAATVTSAVSRRTNPHVRINCDTNLIPARKSEPHQGGIQEVRIGFDVAPGGGGTGATLEQATCAAPAFVPYAGASVMSGVVAGNELILSFAPPLENARSYRINLGPTVTTIGGQTVEVRGLIGDTNGDGFVNATDRSVVVSAWTGGGFSCPTDLNNDGATNATDRSVVVSAWTGGTTTNCAP